MFGRVKRSYRAVTPARPRSALARYDSAQTVDENRKHWALADGLSAVAANSLDVRTILRNRARYEIANNCYAQGIVETYADDIIGTGPRLQLKLENRDATRTIEQLWRSWAKAVHLAETLHTAVMSRTGDGEAFLVFATNASIPHEVQLCPWGVECDQFTGKPMMGTDRTYVDGIRFDRFGNPLTYDVLREHPGGSLGTLAGDFDTLAADQVIHLFRRRRPGQVRGYPDITPALPLYGNMRRFTLAVIAAAEAAANHAGVIESQTTPEEADSTDPLDVIDLEPRSFVVMPNGWRMNQLKAEQPTTTYGDFKHEIVNEIARCLAMPYNIAAGNSAGYNYSSGRLDHQTYFKRVRIERQRIELRCLERIFMAWLDEATLVGLIPDGLPPFMQWPHQWFWDGAGHIDEQKEAAAQGIRLTNRTTTYAEEYARKGQDWEEEFEQLGEEIKRAKALGIPLPGETPAVNQQDGNDDEQSEDDDEMVQEKAGGKSASPAAGRGARGRATRV